MAHVSIPPVTPETSEVIRRLIISWHAGPDAGRLRLNEAARKCGGLPVYGDIGGVLFLRPDGQILRQSTAFEEAPVVETDPQWRLIAVVSAARRFAELSAIVPPKPSHARECLSCGGIGEMHGAICGECSGLGWTHAAV